MPKASSSLNFAKRLTNQQTCRSNYTFAMLVMQSVNLIWTCLKFKFEGFIHLASGHVPLNISFFNQKDLILAAVNEMLQKEDKVNVKIENISPLQLRNEYSLPFFVDMIKRIGSKRLCILCRLRAEIRGIDFG